MANGVVTIPLPGQPLAGDSSSQDGHRGATTLEFFAGPENCLVEPAVSGVLGRQPTPYNPLVLYGPSGTGKSHLARGLAATWKLNFPQSRVAYTTAVDFAREMADAFEAQAVEDFRARYRGVSLAVFEDVGELAAKPAAQEELMRTLDAVIQRGGQVVVTASSGAAGDRRFFARLAESPVGRTVRAAGLAGSRHATGDPPAVVESPRSGNGRLDPQAPGRGAGRHGAGTAGRDAATGSSGPRGRPPDRCPPDPRLFVAARLGPAAQAARHRHPDGPPFRPPLGDLRGSSRRRPVVAARDVAIYLCRQLTRESLGRIGEYFGGRDHTTVLHACRKTEELLQTDPAIRQAMDHLQRKFPGPGKYDRSE